MMNDDVVTALAKSVREYVTEKMMISGELAVQIAGAARLLHEAPPIEQPAAPKLTRIERDDAGNFIPIYGDPQT